MINQNIGIKNEQQKMFWDKESIQANYCKNFIGNAEKQNWIQMLLNIEKKRNINVSGYVLEIGGGSQYMSRYIAKHRDSNVICTDISEQRILDFNNFYNETLPNLKTLGNVNAQILPFPDSSFDFIIGEAVLHHIEDFRTAAIEINRCLKPNGIAIFTREPVVGHDNFIKRPIKLLLSKFSDFYLKRKEDWIIDNRYEFPKTYFQWKEEFEISGFKSSFYMGWYKKNYSQIIQSLFPIWYGCLVSIYLEKVVDANKLEWSKIQS